MRNDIILKNENALAQTAFNELGQPIETAKVLCVSKETPDFDFSRALAQAAQLVNAEEAVRSIQKGFQYVVQVPLEHQAELASGAIEMMHGETSGKTWATLVRKHANGKNEIVCNCPIAKQQMIHGNSLQSMTDVYQNLYMQQKLAELSKQIEEVYQVCLRIEQGQTDDRIGMLKSGREDMRRALMRDPGEQRNTEMAEARSKISTAQHQIGENFKSRLNSYTGIPKSHFMRTMKEIFSLRTDYMAQKDAEFEKIQDYFEVYLKATQLLASSYAVCGDTHQAEDVYRSAIDFLKDLDYSKLQTLRYVHSEAAMQKTFCYHATEYVETEKVACLEDARQYDYITLSVSGEELLEVLSDGRKEIRKAET